ncbi:MAG: redoxin domain-containing protein [Planctomycetota bacterium]
MKTLCASIGAAILVLSLSPCSAVEPVVGAGIGTRLKSIDLDDFRGRRWQLGDFDSSPVVVVAFLGTECPLAKLYAVRLQKMSEELEPSSVSVIGVMSNRHDSLLDIQAFARRQEVTFPLLKDAGGKLADQLGAKRTPEVFVFDDARTLRYHGRVDDQYGIGYVRDEPRRQDLREALDELLSGRDISRPQTEAVGCIIGRKKETDSNAAVTYGEQIAKILHRNCVECHREGEIAPFALTDYEEVAGWADMIAEVVREGRMPPWHANEKHGEFANARIMTDEEKQMLYDWADAGTPAGDMSDLPELSEKIVGWQLPREPEHVFDVSPKPFTVPAEGAVRYQYFKVDPGFEKDVWISAAELKPGNRAVVHHILAFAREKGARRGLDGERGFLVGYVPGARVDPWPKGHAKKIPANSELIFQVHYTPIGSEELDQSQLGICTIDESDVTHEVVTTSAVQTRFTIKPYESDQLVSASSPSFPENARLLGMSPHMHVRGQAFEYALKSSGEILLSIPQYDFNWQTTYVLDPPMELDHGDRMVCKALFDNSAENLNNPDPSDTVHWGDQTWDEMMIGYFHLSVPREREDAGPSAAERRRALLEQNIRLAIFDRQDKDGDGKLIRRETPSRLHKVFDELDGNRDGVLTRTEVETGSP